MKAAEVAAKRTFPKKIAQLVLFYFLVAVKAENRLLNKKIFHFIRQIQVLSSDCNHH